jgi:hypothetical protein
LGTNVDKGLPPGKDEQKETSFSEEKEAKRLLVFAQLVVAG